MKSCVCKWLTALAASVLIGTSAWGAAAGTGTEADPYQIATSEDWAECMVSANASKTFKLVADITLLDVPAIAFTGKFTAELENDGRPKYSITIPTNATMRATDSCCGLFSTLSGGGIIENIRVYNNVECASPGADFGALLGAAKAGGQNATVRNCEVYFGGRVTNTAGDGNTSAFVGRSFNNNASSYGKFYNNYVEVSGSLQLNGGTAGGAAGFIGRMLGPTVPNAAMVTNNTVLLKSTARLTSPRTGGLIGNGHNAGFWVAKNTVIFESGATLNGASRGLGIGLRAGGANGKITDTLVIAPTDVITAVGAFATGANFADANTAPYTVYAYPTEASPDDGASVTLLTKNATYSKGTDIALPTLAKPADTNGWVLGEMTGVTIPVTTKGTADTTFDFAVTSPTGYGVAGGSFSVLFKAVPEVTYSASISADTNWVDIVWTSSDSSLVPSPLPPTAKATLTVSGVPTITFDAANTDPVTLGTLTISGDSKFAVTNAVGNLGLPFNQQLLSATLAGTLPTCDQQIMLPRYTNPVTASFDTGFSISATGETGDAGNPYTITSQEDWTKKVAVLASANKTFKVTQDFELTNVPALTFSGTLTADAEPRPTITIAASATVGASGGNMGLLSILANGAEVKNVVIVHKEPLSRSATEEGIGGVAGEVADGASVMISNVAVRIESTSTFTSRSTDLTKRNGIGGIVGYTKCTSTSSYLKIEDCLVTFQGSFVGDQSALVGGLIGRTYGGAKPTNTNVKNNTVILKSTAVMSGLRTGGLVGQIWNQAANFANNTVIIEPGAQLNGTQKALAVGDRGGGTPALCSNMLIIAPETLATSVGGAVKGDNASISTDYTTYTYPESLAVPSDGATGVAVLTKNATCSAGTDVPMPTLVAEAENWDVSIDDTSLATATTKNGNVNATIMATPATGYGPAGTFPIRFMELAFDDVGDLTAAQMDAITAAFDAAKLTQPDLPPDAVVVEGTTKGGTTVTAAVAIDAANILGFTPSFAAGTVEDGNAGKTVATVNYEFGVTDITLGDTLTLTVQAVANTGTTRGALPAGTTFEVYGATSAGATPVKIEGTTTTVSSYATDGTVTISNIALKDASDVAYTVFSVKGRLMIDN